MEIVKDIPPSESLVKDEPKKPKKVQYDPNKKYRWEPDAQFTFSGQEFGIIINALRMVLSTPEAQRVIMAERANEMIEGALVRSVEAGISKEVEETKK